LILDISGVNQEITVEITASGGNRKIRLGDTEISCDCVQLAEGHYSLILDGSVSDLIVNLDTDICTITSRAGTHSFRIMDRRRPKAKTGTEVGPTGLQQVRAQMPGKIIRVLVREGEPVEYDQGLLVLEAMKMQNEIRAPKSGIVKAVAVVAGATVNTGDLLLSVES
jgi:acetyl/propionyl-CoA carboxylase alpha subunit